MDNLNYSFDEVVAFEHAKKGQPKFNFKQKQSQICQVLKCLGFRRARAGQRYIYYVRTQKTLIPVTFHCLQNGFANYLKQCNESTLPDGVTTDSLLKHYFKEKPIVENGFLKSELEESLNSEDIAKLLSYPIEYN